MCGICGYVIPRSSSRTVSPDQLRRMRDAMEHRGPDDAGVYHAPGIGLGHRRLSIVDVEGGHQPFSLGDRFHLVYNGEIYNHLEIRRKLEDCGHRYRTRCDTETVLRSFAEYGAESVNDLRGMFAYAVWDREEGELVLIRDRLGIKPLYYFEAEDGSLFFASEIKALLASESIQPRLNFEAFPDFLANRATSGATTLFHGIRRLLPGHILRWRDGVARTSSYWELSACLGTEHSRSDADLVEEFTERLKESVRLRLMADVPLGSFLSGGIDSAAITTLMNEMVDEPIKTFSVGFAEREANELEFARLVSDQLGTEHHEVLLSPDDFFDSLPRLLWHEDEPIAHPSSIPLHFVARLAAQKAKVVLTGEGSDELLGGYGWHWKTRLNVGLGGLYEHLTPAPIRGGVRFGVGSIPGELGRKLRRTFLGRSGGLRSLYLENFAVFSMKDQERLLSSQSRERIGPLRPYAYAESLMTEAASCSLLEKLLYVDLNTFLQELLMKQDQMSMAASLESRVPFLDHELVEFATELPERLKVRGWSTKRILRKSMKERLPAPILARKKMGFPVPVDTWFRAAFRHIPENLLLDRRSLDRGILQAEETRRLVSEHVTGRGNHWLKLWSLVNLELWMRMYIDGEGPDLPESRRMMDRSAATGMSVALGGLPGSPGPDS